MNEVKNLNKKAIGSWKELGRKLRLNFNVLKSKQKSEPFCSILHRPRHKQV
jgi:hypothetical protein